MSSLNMSLCYTNFVLEMRGSVMLLSIMIVSILLDFKIEGY